MSAPNDWMIEWSVSPTLALVVWRARPLGSGKTNRWRPGKSSRSTFIMSAVPALGKQYSFQVCISYCPPGRPVSGSTGRNGRCMLSFVDKVAQSGFHVEIKTHQDGKA